MSLSFVTEKSSVPEHEDAAAHYAPARLARCEGAPVKVESITDISTSMVAEWANARHLGRFDVSLLPPTGLCVHGVAAVYLYHTQSRVTYVDSLEFTVVNSLGGQPIDFALPTDTNNDGVINSSDVAKTNYLTISYDDAYQQVSDLAWTVYRIVGDSDFLLENNEIFKVTVDLKAVNLATTGDGKIGANHTFNLEVKPVTGAVLVINKTTPQVLYTVDDLN